MDFEQRFRDDLAKLAGDPEAAALAECMRRHLFDSRHHVGSMLRACGASRAVQKRLAAKVGALKGWVTELRMLEAKRRVCTTDEPFHELCKQVGYGSGRNFRRAFGEAHGSSPREMRKQARAERAQAELTGAIQPGAVQPGAADLDAAGGDSAGEGGSGGGGSLHPRARADHLRRRTDVGLLDAESAAELRLRLRRHHPSLAGDRGGGADGGAPAREEHPIVLTPAGDRVEELAVNAVLGELIDAPEAEARFAMRRAVLFGNVPAYRHLQRICLHLIPHRPERALLLAELGVQMIERHRMLMADEADQWQADAWVFLARVQAFLGHTGDADQSLAFALAEVGGAEGLAPWVEIELRQVEGRLRRRQRRREEAARALDRAVELGRELPATDPDRWQTLLQRLELASTAGDAALNYELTRELHELVEADAADSGRRLTLWRALLFYHRARVLVATGEECCAEAGFQRAIELIADDPECETDGSLGLLFTLALHERARAAHRRGRAGDCERDLRFALERYRRFEAAVFEAVVEAELAVLLALDGRRDEARPLAAAAASFLDDLPFHREAWNAARRLRELAQTHGDAGDGGADPAALAELLATLRRDLDLVAWEITGSQARPAFATRRGLE